MVSNNGEMLRDAAVAGLGLILLPEFIVAPALARGELVTVLDEWHPASLHLNALYPQHRQRSEINRVFMTFLQAKLAANESAHFAAYRSTQRRCGFAAHRLTSA